MKNKIILIAIALFLVIAAIALIVIFTPKRFLKYYESYDVTGITVYDSETDKEFNIDQTNDIEFIVDNLKNVTAYRSKLSSGDSGSGLRVTVNDDEKTLEEVIINGGNSLRDDKFVYETTDYVCYDYIKNIENETDEKINSTERVDVESGSAEPHPLVEGELAPDFTVELCNGNTFKLSDYDDKVVVVNFWATWCGPCVGEMPAFERLKNDGYDKLEIVCINYMEDKKTVDDFVSEQKYTFNIGYDENGKINTYYPSEGIPYTLIIANGRIHKIFIGAYEADVQYDMYKTAIEECMTGQN